MSEPSSSYAVGSPTAFVFVALSIFQLRTVAELASRDPSDPSVASCTVHALPPGDAVDTTFSSTTRFDVPSTSKSIRKAKKC